MKSSLSNKKVKFVKRYPYIGVYTTGRKSFIVLFTKKNTGVVIHKEGEEDLGKHNTTMEEGTLGKYSTTWEEDLFKLYEYTVSLSN